MIKKIFDLIAYLVRGMVSKSKSGKKTGKWVFWKESLDTKSVKNWLNKNLIFFIGIHFSELCIIKRKS